MFTLIQRILTISLFLVCGSAAPCPGQSTVPPVTLEEIPGYDRVKLMLEKQSTLQRTGRVAQAAWSSDGKFLNFTVDGQRRSLDLTSFRIGDYNDQHPDAPAAKRDESNRKPPVPRAEQRTVEVSPDGRWKAVYRDYNVWLVPGEGNTAEEKQITQYGNERLRYGTCCWVYGEELDQNEAMWWSPDGTKLAFYEVNEEHMKDYHLTVGNTDLYTSLKTVRYPKAGEANPKVSFIIYNLAAANSLRIKVDGEATQYLYNARFSPNGREFLFNRTNRHQNQLDVLAADFSTGEVRTVVSESQDTWQNNAPVMQFLEDGQRFVWETEANGYRHFQLRRLDGRLLNPLSLESEYPCEAIVEVDEETDWFYYSAYSDTNPYNLQLHRVRLDGTDHRRITASPLNHTQWKISPDHRFVMAVRESMDVPPETVVYEAATGREVASLVKGTTAAAEELGLPSAELFSFTADDGKTTIWGTLQKPSHFDPNRRYPLLISVYGGPGSRGLRNRYSATNPYCEMGYLIAKIGNRGTIGRGKAFESANYMKLGTVDLDDQAAGVRFLCERNYVDADRVGIYGHSYGGYMSALAMLRYPDLFHVAVSGAPVTDWKNYDTIYTERYMRTPQENPDGYQVGSCETYIENLSGRLLLVHGLIDDNVHPSNTWQLIQQLQQKNKRFDLMIYPGYAHGIRSTYPSLRWEYFYKHLNP